ncbi:hypothetical protein CBR_g30702 [Chara braunii]|uniref:Uncharacterized protein n=1 Tax=Chara braunii TaxID=69332 RepID=A0A388LDE9_CHABU|nr:hypothetical protein CBR_g30702 [Chara braunii]|eukprot:GBG80334.1 hypothetical protein CBR_g30702 [Chara braunii]
MELIPLDQAAVNIRSVGWINTPNARRSSLDEYSTKLGVSILRSKGVHKAGGPSTVDNHPTLESLADRSASDIRGRKIEVDNKGFDKADKGQHRQVEKSAPSASGGSLQRRPSLEKGDGPADADVSEMDKTLLGVVS